MSEELAAKHPGGRPSKYDPEFCAKVIEVGAGGGTLVEMAEACDVERHTIGEWMKTHPEFSTSVKRGLQKAQVLWEQQGKLATFGGVDGFNATSYIFNMKNRFKEDWRDKVETDVTGNMSVEVIEWRVKRPAD